MRRVACGLVSCSKTADFRVVYRKLLGSNGDAEHLTERYGRLLAVNRCREHRMRWPKGAQLVRVEAAPKEKAR